MQLQIYPLILLEQVIFLQPDLLIHIIMDCQLKDHYKTGAELAAKIIQQFGARLEKS